MATSTTIQDDYDHLYTCLESDTLPPVPTAVHVFQNPEAVWPEEPSSFICRAWASNAMPYQGFLPAKIVDFFQGDLFKVLAYRTHDIPLLCASPGQWRLEEKTIEAWATLEELLSCFRDILANQIVCQRSMGHCSFPLPRRYGYHHVKPTKTAMRRCATRSRDAFILMGAEISYLLALASTQIDGCNFNSWPELLTEAVGCEWVTLIRSSWLVQPDLGYWTQREPASRRLGIFIDPRECDFAYFLKAYHAFGVPVWIDWGPMTNPFSACDPQLQLTYKFLLPPKHIRSRTKEPSQFAERTYDIVKGIWRWKFRDEMFDLQWTHDGFFSLPRQRLGETWEEFFCRLEKETKLMMVQESARDARKRETRDLIAKRQCYPTKTSNVFVWNSVDGKDYLVRSYVPPTRISDVWDLYASSQRRYSAFWDEWDLNQEFDLSVLQETEAEEGNQESGASGPSVGPDLIRPGMNSRAAWEAVYTEMFKPKLQGTVSTRRECMTLEEVIRYRCGVVTTTTASSKAALTGVEKAKTDRGLKLLGCYVATRDKISPLSDRDLLDLVDGFNWIRTLSYPDAKSYVGQIPRDTWDFSSTCPHYLRHGHQRFTVTIIESWNKSITGYEIQITDEKDVQFKLVLYHATDVLHVFRLSCLSSIKDIVEEICTHGIQFMLSIPITNNHTTYSRPVFPEPPLYRPHGFAPDVEDFRAYLWKRGTLFDNPATVRAALMHGGIIWRIALDHIDDPSFVLSGFERLGPCTENTIQWKPNVSHKDSWETWTETLSENQIDVICGVYKVHSTSITGFPMQDISWFPKPTAFKKSGLDLGFWSADAERWYIARVQMYLTGDPKARCQNHSDWRHTLRLWARAPQLYGGMEIVSKRFLERHFTSR